MPDLPASDLFGYARTGLSAARLGTQGLEAMGAQLPTVIGPGLGALGGVLGLGYGGYQLAEGNPAGAASLLGGAAGLAGAAGSYGAGGALGPTIAAAAPALTGFATVAAPVAAIMAIGFMNMMHQNQKAIENQTQESGTIRREYAAAVPTLQRAQQAAQAIMSLPSLPPAQQQAVLQQAMPALEAGISTISPISRFISTSGQGGAHSLTKPADTSAAQAGFRPALTDTLLGYLYASDAAARSGMPVQQIPGQNRDPAALLNQLARGTTGVEEYNYQPYLQHVDYSGVGPGNQVDFFRQQLSANIPNFAQTPLGQRFAQLPTVPGQVDPAAIQRASQERAQTAQTQIRGAIGNPNIPTNDLNAIAYAAPYAGGLEQNLMPLIPRGMNQQEGLAMIQDLVSRGASPVNIAASLQQTAEARNYNSL